MNATTIKTRSRTAANQRKRLAEADAALALANVTQQRREALARIEAIIAKGESSIAELSAILPLLEGHARGLLEDVIGAASCGSPAWSDMLRFLPGELRCPTTQYQPGLEAPVPYQRLD